MFCMEATVNNTTTVRNYKGVKVEVDAKGLAFCDSCTGEFDPDDMKGAKLCVNCYHDLHADDWTMEDA